MLFEYRIVTLHKHVHTFKNGLESIGMVQYIQAHITTTIVIRVSCNTVLLRTAQHTKISNIRKYTSIAIQGLSPLEDFHTNISFLISAHLILLPLGD